MRLFTAIIIVATTLSPAFADDEPTDDALVSVEARVGYGATMGGGAAGSGVRSSPATLQLRGSWPLRTAPTVAAFAAITAELGDRAAVGGSAGAVVPLSPAMRASGGATVIVAPYRLAGPVAALGGCYDMGGTRLCVDLEASFFAVGNDLPDGVVATQVQLVFGLGFDVL